MSDRRIVERLREWPLSEKLAREAAARIEALEAALAEAERVNIKLFADYTSRVGALEAAIAEGQTKQ